MRFTGGSVTEEKRRNGKSFNPKHWRICLSFTYDEEQEDGSTKKKRKRVTRIVEGTKTHAYEERDKLIAELDGKGETLDEVVQQQKEQEKVDNMTLTKLIELWDAARRTASKASERTHGGPQPSAPRGVPSGQRARQGRHHSDGRADLRRHPAERPRGGNDARQPAQRQARGRRTERTAGKRCSDPRRIIPVAPSREPSQSHGKVTAEGSKGAYENRPARPISELTCVNVGRGGRI